MPRTVTVKLGAKRYVVTELPRGENRHWLKRIQKLVGDLTGQVQGLGGMELNNWDDLKGVAGDLWKSAATLASTDTMLELMYDYSPVLRSEKTEIEESDDLYDSEITEAFIQVVGLATPFGQLWTQAASLISRGANTNTTGSNSPAPNGEPKA